VRSPSKIRERWRPRTSATPANVRHVPRTEVRPATPLKLSLKIGGWHFTSRDVILQVLIRWFAAGQVRHGVGELRMTDRPRFARRRERATCAHLDYHGGRFVDFVLRCADSAAFKVSARRFDQGLSALFLAALVGALLAGSAHGQATASQDGPHALTGAHQRVIAFIPLPSRHARREP
jgi:hypothetical protein